MEMVNLLLSLTVALLLCFSPAAGIKCYECAALTCTNAGSKQTDCGPKEMCMAATIHVKGRSPSHHTNCAPPAVCPSPGTRLFSLTTKFSIQVQITCCNSGDLCNSENILPPVPAVVPGPLKCPICNPKEKNCNPVQCNQLEDRCFKTDNHEGCTTATDCAFKTMSAIAFIWADQRAFPTFMKCITPGIKCYRCYDETCFNVNNSKVYCPPKNMCMTGTLQGGDAPSLTWQDCADATVCPSPGDHSFSITDSKGPVVSHVSCCNTDNCNTNIPTVPIAPPPAEIRKCPKCDPGDENCPSVQCHQQEDACFTAKDKKGCASVNTCTSKRMKNILLDVSLEGSDDHDMNCNELQCEMCLDPCTSCSQTTIVRVPPGTKCVAASIRDSITGEIRVMKAVAPAPLCSGPGPQTFSLSPGASASLEMPLYHELQETPTRQKVQVTCCDTDLCNSQVPEFDEFAPVQPLVPCATPDLVKQLHLLVNGAGMLPQANCPTDPELPH